MTGMQQLAAHLGVPDEILTQALSPDMMKGITDELAVGMSYEKIDIALDLLEGGLTEKQVATAGVTRQEIDLVREMKHMSRWKGELPRLRFPVDGGPTGGLRLSNPTTDPPAVWFSSGRATVSDARLLCDSGR